jgi:hypothetical protein
MEECILKTRYFRRKQNSDAVEWIEMSGAEYLDFVRDPENKDRFFLNMKNVVLECSKEEYLQSRTEKRRSDYLAESKKGWTIISLFAQVDKESTGEEVIPDPDADVEENILHTLAVQRVREVVDALPEEDAALLRALYLQTPPLTLRAYSEKTGIPVMTLHYRKEKLLRLLKQQI